MEVSCDVENKQMNYTIRTRQGLWGTNADSGGE